MALDFQVNLQPEEAAELINHGIVEGSITGVLIDKYLVHGDDGKLCIVSVYEKHYYRAGNRLTLTAVIDNMEGATRVHCVSGGGGEGLFRFDWGASESFEYCVEDALAQYKI
ncbi:MAG: DUF6054 family protein [Bacillota bacterium]|jgi:hypothetical protein|nr:DUF6054 family protein [Bacillota bacterium]